MELIVIFFYSLNEINIERATKDNCVNLSQFLRFSKKKKTFSFFFSFPYITTLTNHIVNYEN